MNRLFLLIFLQVFFAGLLFAQSQTDSLIISPADTIPVKDTMISADTVFIPTSRDSAKEPSLADTIIMGENILGGGPATIKKEVKGKEALFYMLLGVLLFFASLNRLFPKYFNDLYRLFFRTTLNQSQIREQMIQSPIPSLLLNAFFVITGGLYLDFIFQHYQLDFVEKFWLLYFYCCLGLTITYLIKYFGIKTFGWLFNVHQVADSYIFIVFVINKMIGIFLLPVVVLLAFVGESFFTIILALSFCGIGALFLYRFILTYSAIRKKISINQFHFFIYLFAIEIIPLFIIYKVLLVILPGTA